MDTVKVNENAIVIVNISCMSISLQLKIFMFNIIIMELIQTKRLCITDQLIAGISFSSALEEILELSDCISYVISGRSVYDGESSIITNVCFLTVELCFSWFCSWLCIHFCLKIVNIKRRMYIYLQRRFPKMFPWIFIPSISGLLSLSVLAAFELTDEASPPNATVGIFNETMLWTVNQSGSDSFFTLIYVSVSSASFLLSSSSAVTIIHSLYRHVKHMQDSAEGSRKPNLAAHIGAVKIVTLILILNVISFTNLMLCIYNYGHTNLTYCLAILASIFHCFSFMNLVKASSKLDKTITDILSHCPFLQKRENNHTVS